MKVGARNDIQAEVTAIKKGDVMTSVKVKVAGSEVTMGSVMTTESLDEMNLKVGDTVRVVVKAVNVLLTKN